MFSISGIFTQFSSFLSETDCLPVGNMQCVSTYCVSSLYFPLVLISGKHSTVLSTASEFPLNVFPRLQKLHYANFISGARMENGRCKGVVN